MSAAPHRPTNAKPCPECGRAPDPKHAPFCSARCRTLDLGRWLGGGYAIPGEPVDPDTLERSQDTDDER